MKKKPIALEFSALQIEGNLISPAMLSAVDRQAAGDQAEADYGVPKGLTIRDEVARYFRIGQALFADFAKAETPSSRATTRFVEQLLGQVLGFSDITHVGSRTEDGRLFAITLEALSGRVPIVVVPPTDDLDHASESLPTDGRKRSAATAMQDWLNHSDAALWGLASDGEKLRLMRDNQSLTRPTFIEANLRQIFEAEDFASFAALWLLMHASRFGKPPAPATDCALERWREQGSKQGIAARDRLRDGVEAALVALGTGFLAENPVLRDRVTSGDLPLTGFFSELLRLVYRLIFLMAAEDRDLLHPLSAPTAARRLYAQGYSLGTLRERSIRRSAWDAHRDRWEGLKITFAALDRGEKLLGLPALGGLFACGEVPDLDNARLSNRALMEAIYRLAWLKDASSLQPVNWRDMETEELGSVYESLLELTPRLVDEGRAMTFAEGAETKGNQRKTTGSYYTPDSLVQALLDSALDPVLDRTEAEADDPGGALERVTVIDPACGSGHFLLAAARRIATRLARVRCGGVASAADYRHALRDVVRNCIHGVDRNPMAVELTKVALWIETVEPGKPLGFLDANIRCGDALLGIFDLDALKHGIPDAAYKPLTGDDKEAAKIAGRNNRAQREERSQQELALAQGRTAFSRASRDVKAMPEDDVAAVRARARAFEVAHADRSWWAAKTACDLYVAAFLIPKKFRAGAMAQAKNPDLVPTTRDVRAAFAGRSADHQLVAKGVDFTGAARAFHWPLEFPDIFERGGFDCVLGNPPWERIKLQEQEFFAARDPEIAEAANAAVREQMIAALAKADPGTRECNLHEEFELARRTAEATSTFVRTTEEEVGRFPLTGRGDVNTYALFTELFSRLAGRKGRAGAIVPTGIATDATTAPFFGAMIDRKRLASLFDFENRDAIFSAVHRSYKFSLLTIGSDVEEAAFAFFLTNPLQLGEPERNFTLTSDEIAAINPNTKTAPVFRSAEDARLATSLSGRHGVISLAAPGTDFYRCVDVNKDAKYLSRYSPVADADWVPLYEGKMLHFFDHRAAGYGERGDDRGYRVLPETALDEHQDPSFRPAFFWQVRASVVEERLPLSWPHQWLIAYKDISSATNERSLIGCIVPRLGTDYSIRLCFPEGKPEQKALFAGMLNSFVFDYMLRQKMNGLHISDYIMKQMPICALTSTGSASALEAILELTYTSKDLQPFALDLGFDGPPFAWNEGRRANLRAELDAFYARAYGLTRDELRYILDPADVKGPDYPSETFRVLKNNEVRKYGEYRTQRLVLEAWDKMEGEWQDRR
ncbi:N-6 DNA methylase [Mesorhizobium sp. CA13]|uniref:Eco57I restriction-modification methylase domain-containing protein n=1 Tax=Mesorhizobium sp. CA13 TaxID=2876643 RepID=UPI001CCEC60C|nr:N-6 DNA methylase [Mesorhizobium sp. CA13]MBZ9857064.1 N-6 DNA methylase [Mesorhizobium sp. CA13]